MRPRVGPLIVMTPYRTPLTGTSAEYFAAPVTFAWPSTRGSGGPINGSVMRFTVISLASVSARTMVRWQSSILNPLSFVVVAPASAALAASAHAAAPTVFPMSSVSAS